MKTLYRLLLMVGLLGLTLPTMTACNSTGEETPPPEEEPDIPASSLTPSPTPLELPETETPMPELVISRLAATDEDDTPMPALVISRFEDAPNPDAEHVPWWVLEQSPHPPIVVIRDGEPSPYQP